jgi:hypothetical protein
VGSRLHSRQPTGLKALRHGSSTTNGRGTRHTNRPKVRHDEIYASSPHARQRTGFRRDEIFSPIRRDTSHRVMSNNANLNHQRGSNLCHELPQTKTAPIP